MESLYTVTSLPDRFLNCGICKKTVDQPRSLPCLHSFCEHCLQDYIRKQGNMDERRCDSFECPDCQASFSIDKQHRVGSQQTESDFLLKNIPQNVFLEKVAKTVVSLTNEKKTCDICERIGKYAEAAVNWCCDCYEGLCESCTGVHQCTSVTSSHQVCSVEEARQKPLSLLLKRKRDVYCTRHEGEIVKLFCKLCSVTLCAQCVTEDHRRCGTCLTISDTFKLHEEDLDNFSGKLDNLQRFVNETKSEVAEDRENFRDRVESIREEIHAVSKNLCQRIQESEAQLLEELDRCSSQVDPDISSRLKRIAECGDHVQKTRDSIEQLLQYGCESEIMSAFSSLRNQTLQTEHSVYDDVTAQKVNTEITFKTSKAAEKFTCDFEKLGDLHFQSRLPDKGLQLIGNWGIACVSRDELVVVDGTNKAIHKFRRGGNLVDQIAVSDEPRDVTHVGVGDIAVTMSRKQILFLSTTTKIKLRQTIKTEKSYHGISTCGSDRLVVTHLGSQKGVDIITMEGVIERTICDSHLGEPIFFEPRYVVSTKGDNQVLLVSDFRQHNIICLSLDGAIKFKYKSANGQRTLNPLGICTDRLGNIFVADYSTNEVVLLTGDGEFQRTVVTDENEVDKPVAIDISRDGRLVVLQNDGMVKVFSY